MHRTDGKKVKETKSKEFLNAGGELTNVYKENGRKCSETMRNRGKHYILKNVFDDSINLKLSEIEISKISTRLKNNTKELYLGKSNKSKNGLIRFNKAHLIGLYTIPV